jgi:cation diffusion facilitator CzcD-associated flavoprotein CzcO
MTHHDVLVVGGGFGGIAVTRALLRAGFDDFEVLEAASEIGGTWRDNTYPGCRCDVESALYSFSFAPNPDWTEVYATQPEILRYLRSTADRVGMTGRTVLDCRMEEARWDPQRRLWSLHTSRGPRTARVLITATGPFNEPQIPALPGLESFAGSIAHTARWPEGLELAGRNVAVIGTGASGIQVVPEIARVAGHLTVIQRTPSWVLPHRNDAVDEHLRAAFRQHPERLRLRRRIIYGVHELFGRGLTSGSGWLRIAERQARAHLHHQVSDPGLRAALTPDYRIGCKRITPSNDYYPALVRPNTTLVPHAATAFTRGGVVTADGTEHAADAVVFATGFNVANPRSVEQIHGRDGRSMADVFAGHPRAYLGSAVHGFPNLFTLLGPNTGNGHTSVLLYQEAQAAYFASALQWMNDNTVAAIDVRRYTQDSFNMWAQRRLRRSVWVTGGCHSWYQDSTGAVAAAWPGSTGQFVKMTSEFDPGGYAVV